MVQPPVSARVVGRDDELAVGRAFLGAAEHGSAVLAIEGPAGMGKTTIWDALVAEARERGFAVLPCRPAEVEASFTLAAVRDMLEGLPSDAMAALPPPQQEALDAVVSAADPTRPIAEHLVGAAMRSLILALAADRPVLVAIDDAQWLDPSSVAALGFVARRLANARVGLLVARRTEIRSPLDVDRLAPGTMSRLVVGPLSMGAMHHVIKAHTGMSLSRPILGRIHTAADGNPLFAIEIARVVVHRGQPGPSDPLPVPPDMRSMLEERVAALPAATRDALLLAAASPRPTLSILRRAAAGDDTEEAIAAAIDAGILARSADDGLGFTHPLLADAVVSRATPGQRRDAHARLASVVEDQEQRARHLALATDGPNAAVAAALESAATHADRRGAPAAAAALLELAVSRTISGDDRANVRRRLALAGTVLRAGEINRASALLRELVADLPAGPDRAEARLLLASVLASAESTHAGVEEALLAVEEARSDPRMHARALAIAARVDTSRGDLAERALSALERFEDPDPVALTHAYTALGHQAFSRGGPIPEDLIARALDVERREPLPFVGDRFSSALATWLKYLDDFEGARMWLRRARQAALDEGDEDGLVFAYSHLPQLELWTGDWRASESAARHHLELAEMLGEEVQRRQAVYNLANVLVHEGRESEARPMLKAEIRVARDEDDMWTLALLLPVLGLLELSLGQWEAAIGPLAETQPLREREAMPGPGRHEPWLVETLVALGRSSDAREALDAFGARAEADRRASGLAGYHRARAIVAAADGRLDDALAALDDALAAHERSRIPFERAYTLLVRGRILRRRRERAAARDAFAESLAVFEGLGATRFAASARDELSRTGIRVASGALTETERRVAELAASGMTSREVAAVLFISPKTVEANLSRVYRKLDVQSRAELGARMQQLQT